MRRAVYAPLAYLYWLIVSGKTKPHALTIAISSRLPMTINILAVIWCPLWHLTPPNVNYLIQTHHKGIHFLRVLQGRYSTCYKFRIRPASGNLSKCIRYIRLSFRTSFKSSVIFWCPIRIPCIDAIGPKGQALTPACTTGAFLPCFWFPIPAMVFLSRRLPVAGVFV